MDFSTPVFQLTYDQISRYIKPHAWSGLHKSFLDTMGNPHKIRIIGWRHEGVLLLCLRHLTLRFQQPLITAEPKKSFMIKHIHNLLAVMWSVVVTGGHGLVTAISFLREMWAFLLVTAGHGLVTAKHAGKKQFTQCLQLPWNVERTHDMNGIK